jgi:hypothetical protein
VINVLDYAAADDTPAIQAVIDANPLTTIYLPGTISLTTGLTWAGEGQRFVGDGAVSFDIGYIPSLITGSIAGPLLRAPTSGRYNGVHIEGLGFRNTSTSTAAVGVDLSQTSRSRLVHCVIVGGSSSSRLAVGLKLAGPAYFTEILGTHFAWCGQGISTGAGGPFSGTSGEPNGTSVMQSSMSACNYGFFAAGGIGMSFVGNTVDSYEEAGIRLLGTASRNYVAGNYIEARPDAVGPANIWVSAATAVDNTFLGNAHAGNGTPFLDTAGSRSMRWDYTSGPP